MGTLTLRQVDAMSQPRRKDGRWTRIKRQAHAIRVKKEKTGLNWFPLLLGLGIIIGTSVMTLTMSVHTAYMIYTNERMTNFIPEIQERMKTDTVILATKDVKKYLKVDKFVTEQARQNVQTQEDLHKAYTQVEELTNTLSPWLTR